MYTILKSLTKQKKMGQEQIFGANLLMTVVLRFSECLLGVEISAVDMRNLTF